MVMVAYYYTDDYLPAVGEPISVPTLLGALEQQGKSAQPTMLLRDGRKLSVGIG